MLPRLLFNGLSHASLILYILKYTVYNGKRGAVPVVQRNIATATVRAVCLVFSPACNYRAVSRIALRAFQISISPPSFFRIEHSPN